MSLNVDLLEKSFERIKPYADDFVASFYENLFAAHPEVKPLFANTEMEKQQKKLLNALVLVVENLRNPEVLKEVLNSLGARHVGYGALAKYYPAVGQVLILTFEQYLQEDWTPENKKAWTDAYGAIAAQMLQGTGNVSAEEHSRSEPLVSQPKIIPAVPRAIPVAEPAKVPVPNIPANAEVEETPALALSELPMELLERSFEKIKPHAEEFAARFYENLFQAHLEIKPLFANTDMALQRKKLLQSLVLVVENLRDAEALGAVLENLGARHVGYGAVPKQYGSVSKALLLTFEQYLQDDWTPEVKKAWQNALTTIRQQMLKGARTEIVSVPEVASATREANIPQPSELRAQIQNESQQLQTKISQQSLSSRAKSNSSYEVLKTIPRQLINTFWILPAWSIALGSVLVMSAVFIFADENSVLGKLLGGVEAISTVVAVVLFIKEAPDRRKQFHYQAWSTIDAAHGVKVSYARILALQDLNEDGVSLRGLDASGAELVEINLSHANLSQANLVETDLTNANLSYANLDNAKLNQVKLCGANLSQAKLGFACLSQANLSSANLSGANLICADLSHANLSGANLRDASLGGANLKGAYLTGANLKNAKVSDYELSSAFIEGAIMPDGSRYCSQN